MTTEAKIFYAGCATIVVVAAVLVWLIADVYSRADACRARGGEPTYDSVTGVHCFSKGLTQ